MGFHLIEQETENATSGRIPSVLSRSRLLFSKPFRGPKFTSVLSAKYTDDEIGLVMYQLPTYSPGLGWFHQEAERVRIFIDPGCK